MHGTGEPSAWVTRWLSPLPAGARVLDLAAGAGRHARWAAARGLRVLAVDRDAQAMAELAAAGIETRVLDLEGPDWPLAGEVFDAVVCSNYLHRPRFAELAALVDEGGRLVFETFMAGHERFGRPSNPDFLLQLDELFLVARAQGLRVAAFEQGRVEAPAPAVRQRLCAFRDAAAADLPGWPLV